MHPVAGSLFPPALSVSALILAVIGGQLRQFQFIDERFQACGVRLQREILCLIERELPVSVPVRRSISFN